MRTLLFGSVTFCAALAVLFLVTSIIEHQKRDVPVGLVIPHHDMVASYREAFLDNVAANIQPETIVLISPDHFNRATNALTTTDRTWETSVGRIKANKALIDTLKLKKDEDPFLLEHGVTSLLQDIKTHFPDTMLVPILAKRSATYADIVHFINTLYKECPDCLLISSVDFSHTSHAQLAALHDEIPLRALNNQDAELAYTKAEVDSPESLSALILWSQIHKAQQFSLFSHTNSGFLTKSETGEMTTHILGEYKRGPKSKAVKTLTFTIAGDTMLARGVYDRERDFADVTEKIGDRFFWGTDASIINLEGVFSENGNRESWYQTPPLLWFPNTLASLLHTLKVTAVSLANNHSNDNEEEGLTEHKKILTSFNIDYFGGTAHISPETVQIVEGEGITAAIIGVYTHRPFSGLIETIEHYQKEGIKVIVYAHWGEEYAQVHTYEQESMAEDWIDAGADLVVGSHPHVVQDVAVYKGVPIVYSLGNFLFDQNQSSETKTGAVISGKFTATGLEVFLIAVNSFLQPYVLKEKVHNAHVDTWTTPWKKYETDTGVFYFPEE